MSLRKSTVHVITIGREGAEDGDAENRQVYRRNGGYRVGKSLGWATIDVKWDPYSLLVIFHRIIGLGYLGFGRRKLLFEAPSCCAILVNVTLTISGIFMMKSNIEQSHISPSLTHMVTWCSFVITSLNLIPVVFFAVYGRRLSHLNTVLNRIAESTFRKSTTNFYRCRKVRFVMVVLLIVGQIVTASYFAYILYKWSRSITLADPANTSRSVLQDLVAASTGFTYTFQSFAACVNIIYLSGSMTILINSFRRELQGLCSDKKSQNIQNGHRVEAGNTEEEKFNTDIRDDYRKFSEICKLFESYNTLLSPVILVSVGSQILALICSWTMLVIFSFRPPQGNSYVAVIPQPYCFTSLAMFSVGCIIGSLPQAEKEKLYDDISHEICLESDDVRKWIDLTERLMRKELYFTGLGFFKINKSLLLTILSTAITYSVILVQTEMSMS